MERILLSNALQTTHKTSSTTNNYFLSTYKLCVTAMGILWMWNVDGQAQCMMPRCLQTPICKNLNNGKLPITYLTVLPGHDAVPNYLIGDPAYPLTQFCLKEYQSCFNNGQVIFNNMLRSARNQVECAFGRLKARWRFLTRKVDLKFYSIPTVIYSCFVLHNYCERNKDCLIDKEEITFQMQQHVRDEDSSPNMPDQVYSYNNLEDELVRSILTDYITHNLPDNYY